MRFRDRREAGCRLAGRLVEYADQPDVIVLALQRGGVPVAYEIAEAICAPLDVFLIRKLGVPGCEDLAMGVVATGGVSVLNHDVVRYLDISEQTVEEVTERERRELEQRELLYRGERVRADLAGRSIILVDDGLATGSTMKIAGAAVREHHPARVIIAVPVASRATYEEFNGMADGVVSLSGATTDSFYAVGLWYDDFSQTTDEEARRLLSQAAYRLRLAYPDEPAKNGSYNQGRGRGEGAHFRSRRNVIT